MLCKTCHQEQKSLQRGVTAAKFTATRILWFLITSAGSARQCNAACYNAAMPMAGSLLTFSNWSPTQEIPININSCMTAAEEKYTRPAWPAGCCPSCLEYCYLLRQYYLLRQFSLLQSSNDVAEHAHFSNRSLTREAPTPSNSSTNTEAAQLKKGTPASPARCDLTCLDN